MGYVSLVWQKGSDKYMIAASNDTLIGSDRVGLGSSANNIVIAYSKVDAPTQKLKELTACITGEPSNESGISKPMHIHPLYIEAVFNLFDNWLDHEGNVEVNKYPMPTDKAI